jgi:hypothetical protein
MPNYVSDFHFGSRDYQINLLHSYLAVCLKRCGGEVVFDEEELFSIMAGRGVNISSELDRATNSTRLFITGYEKKEGDSYERTLLES